MGLSIASANKYLRDRIKGYDTDKIKVSSRGRSHSRKLVITFISNGKLKEIETWDEKHFLDIYITKLQEVIDGKPYDDREYYEMSYVLNEKGEQYDTNNPEHVKNPFAFTDRRTLGMVCMSNDEKVFDIRKAHPIGQNIGFKNVDKVVGTPTVQEFLASLS